MATIFPSESELDDMCKLNSTVSLDSFSADSALNKRLPNFLPLLLAVEQNFILTLKNARMQLVTVSNDHLESLESFIRNACGLSVGGWSSLFRSARARKNEMTPLAYENFLNINKRVFGAYLEDFEKILRNDLDGGQLKTLGNSLLSRLDSMGSGKVYEYPNEVLEAYTTLKSLPDSWDGLIESADAICGKLAELELSDAKLAKKIQNELNDKFKKLYTVNKDSVTLNDVAAVLNDIKSLPEVDPLLGKTV